MTMRFRLRTRYAKAAALVVALTSIAFPNELKAQGVSADQLLGCWRHEMQPGPKGSLPIAFFDLCFRADGTINYVWLEDLDAYNGEFVWTQPARNELVIEGQRCGAHTVAAVNPRVLFLYACAYMGTWVQQCTIDKMDENLDACAAKD
jgi:hypothetical protein